MQSIMYGLLINEEDPSKNFDQKKWGLIDSPPHSGCMSFLFKSAKNEREKKVPLD